MYAELKQGSGKQSVATTMALVRLIKDLVKDKEIGHRIVPIAPDEFRTFGMDSMFSTHKIYSPHGQNYESVDRKLLLAYKESTSGPAPARGHLRGRRRSGSTTAAGSAYATHGEYMIPFYIFYSMFGFQRTGDWFWAMADQLARGFLIGATAGRTTLTGEGLQHADGHSPLLAGTNPAVVHYDPAMAYEVGHIVRSGLERMYGSTDEHPHGENVIFYLTVYNEPLVQPKEPENLDVEGLLRGIYKVADAPESAPDGAPKVQLLGLRRRVPVGHRGRAAAGRGLGRRRRDLVGHLVERARPGRRRGRGVELPAPLGGAADAVRHGEAGGRRRTVRRGQRLHAGRPGPDRPVGAGRLPLAGHRRVRLRRHPRGGPPVLPRRRRVGGRAGARRAGRRGEVKREVVQEAFDQLPHRRPHRGRRREAGGRRRLSSARGLWRRTRGVRRAGHAPGVDVRGVSMRSRSQVARQMQRAVGDLTKVSLARMEREMPWFAELTAEQRAWIGMVLQAGYNSFIAWYRTPTPPPPLTSRSSAALRGRSPA